MCNWNLFGLLGTNCDRCHASFRYRTLPVCSVCERDTCGMCDVPELRVDHDTICQDCWSAHQNDRHTFEPAGKVYPEYLYCRICGASETAHQE